MRKPGGQEEKQAHSSYNTGTTEKRNVDRYVGNYAALKLLVIINFAIQQTFNVYQIFSQNLC